MNLFDALHFLRPAWLWALLALPAIAWLWLQRARRDNAWRGSVDAHLLPHLLEPASKVRRRGALIAVLLAYALTTLALAGPAWKQVPQPAWQSRTPLVIALDLSTRTLQPDLPPSRLLQARAKIATLLGARSGGQVGLIAFADDAYTVAPLTDDAANVAVFLDSLQPDIMPVDGHRTDRAIRRSVDLLRQAGFDRGDILVLTDQGDDAANAAASNAVKLGMRVSVLGLGARASLDAASLRALASAGDGSFVPLSIDDSDLRALDVLQARVGDSTATHGRAGRSWEDAGYWLIPPVMLLALFAFRRGAGVAAMLLVLCVPMGITRAQSAQAPSAQAEPTPVEGTLWRRADQVAAQRMHQGEAAYRKNDFAGASQAYDGVPGADAHYNLGNALARQGQYEAAIAAYDRALRMQPGMDDALANRRAVEAAMKRKPPPGQGDKNDPRSQGKQEQKDQQQASGQSQQQEQSKQQQSQQQSQAQQQSQPDKPADAQAQRAADEAQRERMRQALQKEQQGKAQGKQPTRQESPQDRERRLANEAWLRRVPDDPGGLLRAKFRLEYERRQLEGGE